MRLWQRLVGLGVECLYLGTGSADNRTPMDAAVVFMPATEADKASSLNANAPQGFNQIHICVLPLLLQVGLLAVNHCHPALLGAVVL